MRREYLLPLVMSFVFGVWCALVSHPAGATEQPAPAVQPAVQEGALASPDAVVVPTPTDVALTQIKRVEYVGLAKRDPFASIIALEKQKSVSKKRSRNPLENFDVTDIRLLGIIFDGNRYFASIILPDQKAYTLTTGTRVGLYGGSVEQITQSSILIREYVTDFIGKRKTKHTEIKLRKEEEQ